MSSPDSALPILVDSDGDIVGPLSAVRFLKKNGIVSQANLAVTTAADKTARLALTGLVPGQIISQTSPHGKFVFAGVQDNGDEADVTKWRLLGPLVSELAADVTRTSTTTLTASGLSVDLDVGNYIIDALLICTPSVASSATYAKYQFVAGATLTKANVISTLSNLLTAVSTDLGSSANAVGASLVNSPTLLTTVFQAGSTGTSAITFMRITGGIVVSVAGTLSINFAQSASSAVILSLLAGSYLSVTRGA